MQIQKLILQNFFSYQHATLNLADRGLVLIEGINHDQGGSNGSGKSAILEGLLWCLFGRTDRYGASSGKVCRRGFGETCVYVQISADQGDLLVYRHRDHSTYGNKVLVYLNGKDLTRGTDSETQKVINDLLQMDLDTFKSSILYPQKAAGFASFSDSGQKAILESLLGVQRFGNAQEAAKSRKKQIEGAFSSVKGAISELYNSISEKGATLEELYKKEIFFKEEKAKKLETAKSELSAKEADRPAFDPSLEERCRALLAKSHSPAYLQATQLKANLDQRILANEKEKAVVETEVKDLEKRASTFPSEEPLRPEDPIEALEAEYTRLSSQVSTLETEIKRLEGEIVFLDTDVRSSKVLTLCPACKQPLKEESRLKVTQDLEAKLMKALSTLREHQSTKLALSSKKDIAEGFFYSAKLYQTWEEGFLLRKTIQEKKEILFGLTQRGVMLASAVQEISQMLSEAAKAREDAAELKSRFDAQTVRMKSWEASIEELKKRIVETENQQSPYLDLISAAKEDLASKKRTYDLKTVLLEELDKQLTVLGFWIDGFSNKGVKSLLLDTVTPILNLHTAEYLSYLTDGLAKVTFNTQTQLQSGETREKFNVAVDYKFGAGEYQGVSGGEGSRVDMAVLFALGDLAASRASAAIQLRLLDEPFSALDSKGNEQVVRLLKEKIVPRSRTVLVITHDDNMKAYFDQRIVVSKKDGISSIQEA